MTLTQNETPLLGRETTNDQPKKTADTLPSDTPKPPEIIEIDVEARAPYGAVPLDVWGTYEPIPDFPGQKQLYTLGSLDRIQQLAIDAVQDAYARGWADHELTETLQEVVEMSLIDSQWQRIDRNSMAAVTFKDGDPRVKRARQGSATPADLLAIVMDYPELGSIELAKLCHPLDALATGDMDDAVYNAIAEYTEVAPKPATYRTKTILEGVPAITVLRKQQMASFATADGELAIVRRQAFLVRGDQMAKDEVGDPYLDRKLRKEERRAGEVYPEIEQFLPHLSESPDLKWLQPLATSYYVKNLQTVTNPRDHTKQVARHDG